MQRKALIFFVATELVGGAEHYLVQICDRLKSRCKYNLKIVSTNRKCVDNLIAISKNRDKYIDYINRLGFLKLLLDNRYVIHMNLQNVVAYVGWLMVAALLRHSRTFITVHDTRRSKLHFFASLVIKLAMCNPMISVICVSEKSKMEFCKNYHVDKTRVGIVYPGVELSQFDARLAPPPDEEPISLGNDKKSILIGSIARLVPGKGIDTLLDAFGRICVQYDNVQLAVVGDGSDFANLTLISKRLRLESRVQFLGYQTDVPSFLKQLDIHVCASEYETYSLSTAEAICAGVPSIVTKTCGIVERLELGKDVLSVSPKNSAELANAIELILSSGSVRHLLLVHSAQRRTALGIDNTIEQLEYEYDK